MPIKYKPIKPIQPVKAIKGFKGYTAYDTSPNKALTKQKRAREAARKARLNKHK